MNKTYDLVIIGGGAAGLVAAKFAAGVGKNVILIEHEKLGGECTWTGCIPSKSILSVAADGESVARVAQIFGKEGQSLDVADTGLVMQHVRNVVASVYATHTPAQLASLGIEVVQGTPVFTDAHTIRIEDRVIRSKKVIIATGSHPYIPPIEGIAAVPYLTNQNFFDLERLPESLIILGAGPIGIELAGACSSFGVRVTIVEYGSRILAHEDAEVVGKIRKAMHAAGIVILTGKRAERVEQTDTSTILYCRDENNVEIEVSAEKLLCATGRRANTARLGLENAGVRFSDAGIHVNKKMQTNVPHIYAAGDVTGGLQFSHIAEKQAQIAARNALFWGSDTYDPQSVGWVVFAKPELAHGGYTEEEARAFYGDGLRIYPMHYAEIDRSYTDDSTGFVKIICDKRFRIIGMHIWGVRAGEVLHELQVAREFGIPLHKLHAVMHAYPTYNDIVKQLSKRAYIDYVQEKWVVRFVRYITGWKREK